MHRKNNTGRRHKFIVFSVFFLVIAILQPGYPIFGSIVSAIFRMIPVPAAKQELMAPSPVYSAKLKEDALLILDQVIEEDMSEADQVKVVHDYIVIHTDYDYDNYNNNTIPEESFTAEGVLHYNKAVCQGYAFAFQMFMELLGIESKLVVGYDTVDGVTHAWNMVYLDGDWYHVDVTWDDPVTDSDRGMIQYQYFLVNDQVMEEEHQWEHENYPSCSSTRYQYYAYLDHMIDSLQQYERKFMERYDLGERNITILYPEEGYPDFQFLIKRGFVKQDSSGRYIIMHNALRRIGDYTLLTVILE